MKIFNYFLLAIFLNICSFANAQQVTTYLTGDAADVTTTTQGGIVLMGGAGDNDDAMLWFLEHAGYGDIVILRTDRSDGYNDYLYNLNPSQSPNSVETFVLDSRTKAEQPEIEQAIRNAEGVFIAGGNQANYVEYWKDTGVEEALNYLANTKNAPIGGTSAGCAIQANYYYTAENGTVYSDEALNDPYGSYVTIGSNDFINHSILANTITDTHYDNPDRKGRHTAFLARILTDNNVASKGIGVDEYTAVCVENNGTGLVFGDGNYDDYAYFLQSYGGDPENCTSGNPLTWYNNGEAVKVYKIKGTVDGSNTFDLNTWTSGNGGTWEDWNVVNGSLSITSPSTAPSGGGNNETCDAPTGLFANNITSSSASISWQSSGADSYVVEYKESSANTWIPNTTNSTSFSITGLAAATDYNFRVKGVCSSTESDYTSTGVFTTLTDQPVNYCTSSGDSYYEWIRNIEFEDIYNTSGDDYGYGDYTNLTANVVAGNRYSIYLTPDFANRATTEYWCVWIDYNQDGDFDDAGEEVLSKRSRRSISSSITIAQDAMPGDTRMRISMKYGSYPNPCETGFDGEVEDYTISISTAKSFSKHNKTEIETVSEFKVYPNPANDYMTINIYQAGATIEIYSANGKLMKHFTMQSVSQEIELHELPEGMYLLRSKSGKQTNITRFIIAK